MSTVAGVTTTREDRVIVVSTTPDLLRQMADYLEREWVEAAWGGECPAVVIHSGDGPTVKITVNQESMPINKNGLGNRAFGNARG